ncbi:MAG: hypothetical protein MI919_09255 [Holophagales bacterium]|nr:hypothetical protein [Holophagales bacterium]
MYVGDRSIRPPVRPGRSAAACLALSALALAAPAPGAAASGEVLDLARFGKAGDLMPAVAEGLVDRSFYTQDMTAAAASREYYTAVYSVPSGFERPQRPAKRAGELYAGVERVPAESPALGLALGNPGDEIVDVTVSFRSAEGVHNHLVRIAAGDSVGIRLTESADPETVVLLAFSPFEASIELAAGGLDRSEALDVMPPAFDRVAASPGRGEKAIDYCRSIGSWLRVTDSAGGYVIAYGNRFQLPGGIGYYHEIEYPAGTLFHRASGAYRSGSDPACKWHTHLTTRTDFSKQHRWIGMDDLVLACVGPATATCTSGCTGTFTVTLASSSLGRCF